VPFLVFRLEFIFFFAVSDSWAVFYLKSACWVDHEVFFMVSLNCYCMECTLMRVLCSHFLIFYFSTNSTHNCNLPRDPHSLPTKKIILQITISAKQSKLQIIPINTLRALEKNHHEGHTSRRSNMGPIRRPCWISSLPTPTAERHFGTGHCHWHPPLQNGQGSHAHHFCHWTNCFGMVSHHVVLLNLFIYFYIQFGFRSNFMSVSCA